MNNAKTKDAFLNELLTGENDVSAISNTLGISTSQGMSIVREIKRLNHEWLYIHGIEPEGALVNLDPDYHYEMKNFVNTGGYTKKEYDQPVSDEEKLRVLKDIHNAPDRQTSITLEEEREKFNRNYRILEILRVQGYLANGQPNKMFTSYKLTDKGLSAVLHDSLIDPQRQAHTDPAPGVIYNTTTINQRIGGIGNTANADQSKRQAIPSAQKNKKSKKTTIAIIIATIGVISGLVTILSGWDEAISFLAKMFTK